MSAIVEGHDTQKRFFVANSKNIEPNESTLEAKHIFGLWLSCVILTWTVLYSNLEIRGEKIANSPQFLFTNVSSFLFSHKDRDHFLEWGFIDEKRGKNLQFRSFPTAAVSMCGEHTLFSTNLGSTLGFKVWWAELAGPMLPESTRARNYRVKDKTSLGRLVCVPHHF